MTLHNKVDSLLKDFDNATGKGSLIQANQALSKIIDILVKHADSAPKGCNCNCKTPMPLPMLDKVKELSETKALDNVVKTDMVIDEEPSSEEPKSEKKSPPKKKV